MTSSEPARAADPLVSVIVPVYNGEQFLARTLASISRQTYRNIEIIVQDDGSTDATLDILAAAARQDARILYQTGPNRGGNFARNAAAERARGDALAPCDADDLWHPEKLERQVDALYRRSPDAGVAYCWTDGINNDDAVIFPGWSRGTAEGEVLGEMVVDSLPGCGSTVLVRREAFESAGGFSTEHGYSNDWHFYIELAGLCKWVAVPAPLVGYRLGSHNDSRDYERYERWMKADTDWIIDTWPELPPETLRRRAYVVNRWFAFLALRRGHFIRAMRYRAKAIAAHPRSLLSFDELVGFPSICLLELFRVERYYWPPWRQPSIWPGAVGLDPVSVIRATDRRGK